MEIEPHSMEWQMDPWILVGLVCSSDCLLYTQKYMEPKLDSAGY